MNGINLSPLPWGERVRVRGKVNKDSPLTPPASPEREQWRAGLILPLEGEEIFSERF
jgi:hypothetical protein